jgi:hypothetical protein
MKPERFFGIDGANSDSMTATLIFEKMAGDPPKAVVVQRKIIFGARGLLRLGLITRKQYLKRRKRTRARLRRTAIDRGIDDHFKKRKALAEVLWRDSDDEVNPLTVEP